MFKPGQSGNPAGRTPGTGKVNEYRRLLESKLPELADVLVSKALEGDPAALRLCFERLIPAYRAESMPVNLPITKKISLVEVGNKIISAIGNGEMSPDQGAQVLSVLSNQAKLQEVTELEQRIKSLEEANNVKHQS